MITGVGEKARVKNVGELKWNQGDNGGKALCHVYDNPITCQGSYLSWY